MYVVGHGWETSREDAEGMGRAGGDVKEVKRYGAVASYQINGNYKTY